MAILSVLAGVSFVVTGAVVGARMLWLARRTRGTPELLLGAGLSSLTWITLPCLALSLGPVLLQPGPRIVLLIVGLVPVVGFAGCLFGFTAVVFRPHQPLARAAVGAATTVAATTCYATVVARLASLNSDRVVSPGSGISLIGVFLVGLAWTGFEALTYHRRLRRQAAIGLGDPVTCNRFLLWALGSLGALAGSSLVAVSLALGWRAMKHPVPILAIAFAGFNLSVCWLLSFLPPAAYRRWVTARATAVTDALR